MTKKLFCARAFLIVAGPPMLLGIAVMLAVKAATFELKCIMPQEWASFKRIWRTGEMEEFRS